MNSTYWSLPSKIEYPLSHQEIAPCPGAVKAENGKRYDGLPDGVHTGGGWIYNGKFYKPLDAKPYANAECRIPTREAIALHALKDVSPFFEFNWRIEFLNGRFWLIRPVCTILTPREYLDIFGTDGLLAIEKTVQDMNNVGWLLNDLITIAFNPKTDNVFILDLSSAQNVAPITYMDSEQWRVMEFWKHAGAEHLVKMRQKGHHAISSVEFSIHHKKYKWVYASYNRPVSKVWATLPESAVLLQEDFGNWDNGIPWTWVVTEEPLSEKTIYSYELKLAHFPWFYKRS